jgi:transcriptional antiterminator RfaH
MADTQRESETGWLVLWTESRAEKKVAARVTAKGLEAWLPTVTERHRWSDRWRDVVLPVFPGYLFARGGNGDVHRLLRTPGVLTIVKAGDKPAVLSDTFVHALRHALEQPGVLAHAIEQQHDYHVHDEIIVQEGPLSGLRGVVRQLRGAQHLVVWVKEVGRGVAFTINSSVVAPTTPRPYSRSGLT